MRRWVTDFLPPPLAIPLEEGRLDIEAVEWELQELLDISLSLSLSLSS